MAAGWGGAEGRWSGALHRLAAFSVALDAPAVAARHAAWLVDSAPLALDATVSAAEDTPRKVMYVTAAGGNRVPTPTTEAPAAAGEKPEA